MKNEEPKSHPMRVRGLKLAYRTLSYRRHPSHPMRVRGLKLCMHESRRTRPTVAPHAGAWIETKGVYNVSDATESRTPCGCVD